MKKKLIILLFVCLGAVTACSDDGNPVAERIVVLKGAIGYATRAAIYSGYEQELAVCFCRQDESPVQRGTYGTYRLCTAVRGGGSGSRPIRFDLPQLYPDNGRKIRLWGYYPRDGAFPDDATGTVSFEIDGKTDIMATDLLEGNNTSPVSFCTFNHLQTQLQFTCYSDQASAWGTIRSIEVLDVPAVWQLNLTDEKTRFWAATESRLLKNIRVSGISDLPVPEAELHSGTKPDAQGYILLPVGDETAGEPVQLRIITVRNDPKGVAKETEHRATIRLDNGLMPGMIHGIELFFSNSVIDVVPVRVSEWKEEDKGIIDL